jgi:hypothetical protein
MESKKMMKKELSFMKKKGAPKSMIKHEKAEAKGMNKGGKTSCYATGGAIKKMAMGGMSAPGSMAPGYGGGDSFTQRPVPAGPMKRPMMGGMDSMQEMRGMRGQRGYAKGGMVKADGCATKGKTKGRFV